MFLYGLFCKMDGGFTAIVVSVGGEGEVGVVFIVGGCLVVGIAGSFWLRGLSSLFSSGTGVMVEGAVAKVG